MRRPRDNRSVSVTPPRLAQRPRDAAPPEGLPEGVTRLTVAVPVERERGLRECGVVDGKFHGPARRGLERLFYGWHRVGLKLRNGCWINRPQEAFEVLMEQVGEALERPEAADGAVTLELPVCDTPGLIRVSGRIDLELRPRAERGLRAVFDATHGRRLRMRDGRYVNTPNMAAAYLLELLAGDGA